jgi:hypothetical protein
MSRGQPIRPRPSLSALMRCLCSRPLGQAVTAWRASAPRRRVAATHRGRLPRRAPSRRGLARGRGWRGCSGRKQSGLSPHARSAAPRSASNNGGRGQRLRWPPRRPRRRDEARQPGIGAQAGAIGSPRSRQRGSFGLHCMIAWGRPNGAPLQPGDHEMMEAALAGYDYLRVFQGCGVVGLVGESQRAEIHQKLTAASQQIESRAHVLISPSIQGGTGFYTGYLASNLWDQLGRARPPAAARTRWRPAHRTRRGP